MPEVFEAERITCWRCGKPADVKINDKPTCAGCWNKHHRPDRDSRIGEMLVAER